MSHGCKSSIILPTFFKPGYPIFSKSYDHVMILGSFNRTCITVYALGYEGYYNLYVGQKKILFIFIMNSIK